MDPVDSGGLEDGPSVPSNRSSSKSALPWAPENDFMLTACSSASPSVCTLYSVVSSKEQPENVKAPVVILSALPVALVYINLINQLLVPSPSPGPFAKDIPSRSTVLAVSSFTRRPLLLQFWKLRESISTFAPDPETSNAYRGLEVSSLRLVMVGVEPEAEKDPCISASPPAPLVPSWISDPPVTSSVPPEGTRRPVVPSSTTATSDPSRSSVPGVFST